MNLDQTLAQINIAQPKKTRCFKTSKDLELSASVSNSFFLVKVPVSKIALSASTKQFGDVVVLDKNKDKIGKTLGGFVPKVMILKGHDLVAEAIATGKTFINVWAGSSAIRKLHIMADDAISTNELQSKIQALLQKQYISRQNSTDSYPGTSGPWIREIYPFENYVIFDWQGDQWKQAFVLDPINRDVALAGKPVKVYQEYSEVPKGLTTEEGAKAALAESVINSAAALPIVPSARAVHYYTTTLSQEQDFDPMNNGEKPLGSLGLGTNAGEADVISYGAPSSEYANPPLKLMMNIEEALRLYLASLADGTHMAMPSQVFANALMAGNHPNEYSECKIAAESASAEINVVDFIAWQRKQLNCSQQLKDGLEASAYAYVGDPKDISTWHCAMDSAKSINAGLDTLENTNYVPKAIRASVEAKLEVAARKFSTKQRSELADKGIAKPDGSYPIATKKDLSNAVKDFGRANGSPSDAAHIRKRAKALGVKDPFKKKKEVDADAVDTHIPVGNGTSPGGSEGDPGISGKGKKMKADAEIATKMVAEKGKKMKADMAMPMPSPAPVAQTSQNSQSMSSSGFQPNGGRKKFKVGDKVTTKHGKGRVSDVSKDTVEVTHYGDGKVANLHHSDVKKVVKKLQAGGPGSGRKPGNGLDKTHQWTVSKSTDEHLLKSKGGPVGYSAGTYARVADEGKSGFSARTFGSKGATTMHPSLEEAKDAAEKRVAANRK